MGANLALEAACAHCPRLHSVSVRHACCHSSTLTTLCMRLRGRLIDVELTGVQGLTDLGIKALAAYWLGLEIEPLLYAQLLCLVSLSVSTLHTSLCDSPLDMAAPSSSASRWPTWIEHNLHGP